MIKCWRHGEICMEKIKTIPKLKETQSKEFLIGSHGNPHTLDNGNLYLKKEDDFIFGYFKAKNTTLFHKEHQEKNRDAKLPDGNYRLRRQVEWINNELKIVED